MRKLRQNDEVVVITGNDKGARGSIAQVLQPKKRKYGCLRGPRVIITGVNLVSKHKRGNPQQNQPGGIVKVEAPIDLSNVAIWNPNTKKADRVGFKLLEDGTKVRYFKSNGELIDI